MEMMAAIRALESLKTPRTIKLTTDSMYLKRGITEWIHNWKRQGWRNTSGAVKNKDLWKRLEKATAPHTIEWIHVRGHAGNYWNEQADQYAVLAKSRQTAGRTKPELVGADVRI
jgi:ribonuclease HI